MSVELKIKAKHLALEPGIIRNEEKKLSKKIAYLQSKIEVASEDIKDLQQAYYRTSSKLGSLIMHRTDRNHKGLRVEARATHLARAFIARKAYKSVEGTRSPENEQSFQKHVLPRVAKMVTKYDTTKRSEAKNLELIQEWTKQS